MFELVLDWRTTSHIALAFTALVLVFFLYRQRHALIFKFLLGSVFCMVCNWSLKYVFAVPRLFGWGPSFPSFHTQVIFFVAFMASFEDKRLAWLLVPLAAFIGVSRVTQGFHTVSDVVAGAALGVLLAIWFFTLKLKAFHLRELARQFVHFSGLLLIPLALVFPAWAVGVACLVLAVFLIFAPRTSVKKVADFFQRHSEHGYEGAVLFFFASGVVFFVFSLEVAIAAIVALSVGDAMATIYGTHFGRVKIFEGKTLEGSFACFFFSHVALLFFLEPQLAFIAAIIATVFELMPSFNDNMTIPFGVGLVLRLVGTS